MRVAFTIALMATLALAYSVFNNDGWCSGKKECSLTNTSTAASCSTGSCCSKKCCSDATSLVALTQDEENETCTAGKQCCSKTCTSQVALQQDEETKCEGTCSAGKSCCQEGKDGKGLVTVSVAKQDGECCEGSCSEGKSCCQDGKCSQTVSVAKQDGECCEGKCPSSGGCCHKDHATMTVSTQDQCEEGKCESGKTCCVAAAMKKLPAMTFKVGNESTCCSDAAAKLAEKSGEPIHFVVADEEFDTKEKAFVVLVEKTEAYVNDFITPAKCEASGQTSVCDKSFGCCQQAAKHADLVINATKEIKVAYQVGDKSACCANGAKALAAKENAPIEYVVAGEKTKCEMHARLLAAQAKYAAAVKAIETAEATVTTEAEKTETKTETEVSAKG